MRRLSSLLLCATSLSGCVGEMARTGSDETVSQSRNTTTVKCDGPKPGPSSTRRLSHVEYRYVVEDLFGNSALAQSVAATLVADSSSLGFSNSARLLTVPPVLSKQYMEAAERIAETVTSDLSGLLACNPATAGELACATQFIKSLGRRAYRRPLSSAEEARYLRDYQALRASYDFRTGVEWIVSTMLQAPSFLYRPEALAQGGIRRLEPLELAARLSFLIWHSIPDESLLQAAEQGRLTTSEDVEREARRLLAHAKGARISNFIEEWLDLDKLGNYSRDESRFGTLPADLTGLFKGETQAFVRHVLFEGDGKLDTLLKADFTFVNQALASHYGMSGVSGTPFRKATLPAGRRGIWMQGGPLTAHDTQSRTSIVRRGVKVRTSLLCQMVPKPPDDVELTLGPVDPTLSQTERLAQHRTDPTCNSCHRMMDPLGQTFENLDAVGRLRVKDEGGHTVSTAGEITFLNELDGPVTSGADMIEKLAGTQQVRECFATQLFRYAHGREEEAVDVCSTRQAFNRFQASGYDIRELIVGVALSDDFLYRAAEL